MKTLFVLLLSFWGTASFAHEGHTGFTHLMFNNGAIHAHATWEQGPQTQTESVLRLEWKNGVDHTPTVPNAFGVSLLMVDMGHGSAPPHVEQILDADGRPVVGAYRISKIYFIMGGKWDVLITLKNADGTQDTQAIHLDVGDSSMPMPMPMPMPKM